MTPFDGGGRDLGLFSTQRLDNCRPHLSTATVTQVVWLQVPESLRQRRVDVVSKLKSLESAVKPITEFLRWAWDELQGLCWYQTEEPGGGGQSSHREVGLEFSVVGVRQTSMFVCLMQGCLLRQAAAASTAWRTTQGF